MSDYRRGFDCVTGFIEHLQIVTTSNYSAIANSHTLQFTKARIKSSESAVSMTDPNNVLCFRAHVLTG
jgi:hypothetical protein